MQSLDSNVKPAALLFELFDDLVNVHSAILALAQYAACPLFKANWMETTAVGVGIASNECYGDVATVIRTVAAL